MGFTTWRFNMAELFISTFRAASIIETTKLYYSNIISFLAVHTVTTDSAKYASMYVCTRRLHENLQNNETKILIGLKKACCHFPQKILTMPFLCLEKMCI